MKPEALLHAIGALRDETILDARTPRRVSRPWIKWGAMAACLMLLVSAVLIPQLRAEPTVRVFQKTLSSAPMVVSEASGISVARTFSESAQLAVPLDIAVKDETLLSVSEGILQVFDQSSRTLLYEGSSYSLERDAQVIWVVGVPAEDTEFTLEIETARASCAVLLEYAPASQTWTVRKQSQSSPQRSS